MALTESQKVTIAEITRETYDRISSLVTPLNPSQEAVIAADVALWTATRNKLKVKLEGGSDGVKFDNVPLLDEIRIRTRRMLGLSAHYGQGVSVFAGGISKADSESRAADTDNVQPMFTTTLHQTP